MIEYYIRKKHPEIKVIRRTFTELHQQVKLGPNNELLMYVFILKFTEKFIYFFLFYDQRVFPFESSIQLFGYNENVHLSSFDDFSIFLFDM